MGPGGSMTNRRRQDRRTPRLRTRAGFTMVEVIVASVILGAALLAMAGFTVRYQQVDASALCSQHAHSHPPADSAR